MGFPGLVNAASAFANHIRPRCPDPANAPAHFALGVAPVAATPCAAMPGLPLPLSLSVVACDAEASLRRCLASAAALAEEIVVVDSGSKDGTRAVAAEFGARVIHQDWLGHSAQKQVALGHCTRPWVLVLDADEEVSAELRAAILGFFAEGNAERSAGATMPRRTWFLGRWITHGDWYPDRKLRLFRRDRVRSAGSPEHDKFEVEGATTLLAGDLLHYSFRDMRHYMEKQMVFTDSFLQRGGGFSLFQAVARPLWRFFRAYVLKLGVLDGFPGLWIAVATAFYTFVRYSRAFLADENPRGL